MSTTSNLTSRWRALSPLLKLIVANIIIFLAIRILGIVAMIGGWNIDGVVDTLALPSWPPAIGRQPWSAITYMFTHYDVLHILFNMLALYWFGQLFLYRCTSRQLTALYIYGGLCGGLLYVLAAMVFPAVGGYLLGASAAVIAIVIADAVLMPDYEVNLLLIGSVKLKWLAIGAAVMFALGLVGNNAGGHVAHIGGLAIGIIFGVAMNRGEDITRPLNALIDKTVNFFRAPAATVKPPRRKFRPRRSDKKAAEQKNSYDSDRRQLDAILDKVKKSGYASLTEEERSRLFDVSKRL